MNNWIGIGVWIVMGILVSLLARIVIKQPEETVGHVTILTLLGIFGAIIGGMLGVGIAEFEEPLAFSIGGIVGALIFSAFTSFMYRWGIRSLI
tara:strand:- start:23713 stop:23991 length:279 start_codon:yes stop_codon:yes gene_type:complete